MSRSVIPAKYLGTVLVLTALKISEQVKHHGEHCMIEDFTASCIQPDEVIRMLAGSYGRMRLGRCIRSDIGGHLGCSADVLEPLDHLCSGKQECTFNVGKHFHPSNVCSRDFMTYLEASYDCVKVFTGPMNCHEDLTVPVDVDVSHLASHLGSHHFNHCSRNHGILTAQPGQQVNLSLIDFGWSAADSAPKHGGPCNKHYGHIYDRTAMVNRSICGGGPRESHIYASSGHQVELVLNNRGRHGNQDADRFLIRYQAVGCADLTAPEHGWVRRSGDAATVGCQGSQQEWRLRCVGQKWDGALGTCSQPVAAVGEVREGGPKADSMLPHDVAVVMVAAGAVLVCCIIIMGGVVCVRYFRMRERAASDIYTSGSWTAGETLKKRGAAGARPPAALPAGANNTMRRGPGGGGGGTSGGTGVAAGGRRGYHAPLPEQPDAAMQGQPMLPPVKPDDGGYEVAVNNWSTLKSEHFYDPVCEVYDKTGGGDYEKPVYEKPVIYGNTMEMAPRGGKTVNTAPSDKLAIYAAPGGDKLLYKAGAVDEGWTPGSANDHAAYNTAVAGGDRDKAGNKAGFYTTPRSTKYYVVDKEVIDQILEKQKQNV